MGNDRDSIAAMKRQGPLARITGWTGAIGAIVAVLSQVVPPVWDAMAGDRIARLEAKVAQCQGDVDAQKRLLGAAVQAVDDRIVEAEKADLELEGSIRLIGTEVRLRHGANVDDIPIDNVPRSRSGRLRMVTEKNDERMSGSDDRRRSGSLVDDMRRQGAPVGALDLK